MRIFISLLRLMVFALLLCPTVTMAQISIPDATPVTQNFDGMGTTATASLPANWKMSPTGAASPTWSDAGNLVATTLQASSGVPTTGARYNWGNGTTTSDRALGIMTSGSFASPNSIMSYYRNTNSGNNLTSISVTYNLERYRINTAAASVQFYYSTDGSTWNAVTDGNIAAATIGSGANTYTFATPGSFNPSVNPFTITFGTPISPNGDFYLRWNLNTTGSNSQGIGIDNISVTATLTPLPVAVVISSPSQVTAAPIGIDVADNTISKFELATTGSVSLSQVDIPFGGTYTSSDVSDLKLYYNTTGYSLVGATQFGSTATATATGSGETKSFIPGATLSLPATTYFIVTATTTAGATANRTINTGIINNSRFTFSPVLTATLSASASGDQTIVAAVPPTLTPDPSATVEGDNGNNDIIDLSFNPDNQDWRDNVIDVKVDGVSLAAAAYDLSLEGLLRLHPSQDALLRSPGLKVITVLSTGYGDDVVNQQIDPGAPATLTILPQPTAPASSGAVLGTQPAVTVKDQYGNPVLAGIDVFAAVTSGQETSWTLGGTANASTNGSGVATFSGLTATNLTAGVFSASIDFTSEPATTATSNSFNIPAPPITYVSMTASPLSYSQNFDGLVNTGSPTWTDNSSIPFWYAQRTGTGNTVVADNGGNTAGNLYSYGTGTNTDRALGSLGSGGATAGSFAWGVLFKNLTGSPVTLKLTYTGEQWRNSAAAAQTVSFYYKTSSSSFTALNPNVNTGWTPVSGLNFVSPVTGGSAGALVGNTAPNFTTIANIPLGVTLASNDYIMLKWDDPDHSGTDHGLSIDDVSVSWELPSVTISSPSQVGVNNVSVNSTDNIISQFQMLGATGGGNLTQVNVPLNGTYTSSDVGDIKLWHNTTNTLSGATQFGFAVSATGTGETAGFTDATTISGIVYFFVTADIKIGGTSGRTINTDPMTTSNFAFDAGPAISGSVTASGAQTIQAGVAPTLIAAVGATVDNNIDITFSPDNATWRGNIIDVKVGGIGGTSLPPAAYDKTNAGILRLIPSQSTLLQSSGTKNILVISTGYTNATVSQDIGAGVPNKLIILTQPSTTVNNGTPLTVQPVVAIRDQYGNATTSTATVTAQVGQGSWTLLGTTAVAAVSGTVTYAGLTPSSTAVPAAKILFTCTTPALTQALSDPFSIPVPDQFTLTTIGIAKTEDFTSLGSSATAALPAGFHVSAGTLWSGTIPVPSTSATTVAAGTTGTGVLTGTSGGGTYNYANGVTASSTDRALGFLTSGSFSSPRSIILKMRNNTGATIVSLDVAFDYEKYRSGSRAWDWTFFSGTDGSSWGSAIAGGAQSYAADANNTVISNPPTFNSKSFTLSSLNIAPGADYYLRWTYTGLAGATNAQGLAIDNLSVTPKTCYIWSGGNGNWSTPANWQCGVVPATGIEIISVPAGSPVLDVDYTVASGGSLTISGTGGLTIAPNKTLTITGSADFGGLPVTIQSGPLGTGTIGQIANNGNNLTGATNVTVERYIPSQRAWRLLTIPVSSNAKTIRDAWAGHAANPNVPTGEVGGSGTVITGSAYGNGATAAAAGYDWWSSIANTASSIRRYAITGSSGNWNSTPSTGILLNAVEEGYMLFVRGDRTVTSGIGQVGPTTLRPNGTLKTGTRSYSIPAPGTAAYKLLGNPYAATISFEKVMANGVNSTRARDNRFWIWDATNGLTGGYRLVNKLGAGNWERIPAGLLETSPSYAEYIRSSQAFLVETLTAGTNDFTIEENDKEVPAGIPPAVFDAASAGRFYANLNLDEGSGNLILSDGVKATFDIGGNDGLDGNDVDKIDNFNENISLVRNGKRLTVEARDLIADKDTLFFLMSNLTPRKYAFQFKGVQMQAGLIARLQDTYLGQQSDISVLGDIVTIPFEVTADASSGAADRFRIVFKADPTLPLTLTSAKAYSLNNGVQVDWKTVNERGLGSYEVEKSTDGRSFGKATTVAATGASSYGWYDVAPVKGNNYYRIKGIGTNGDATYSQVLMVNLSSGKSAFSVYPNPVKGGIVGVQFSNMEKGKYSMVVYNSAGQKVVSRDITHLGGSATEEINLGTMASGVYRISLISTTDSAQNQMLVIQK